MGYCPNCGRDAELNEYTGWCNECQPVCLSCGKPCKGKICNNCYLAAYWARNNELYADFREQGLTAREARKKVREAIRPTCLSCNDPMPHTHEGRNICRQRIECRQVYGAYVRGVRKGKDRTEALLEALIRYGYDDRFREVA